MLAYASAERHPLVEAFVEHRWHSAASPEGLGSDPLLDIAAGDEMFSYSLAEQHQHRGLALVSYLRSGLTAYETLAQILSWRFGSVEAVPRLLDFASGYGRTTRFLVTRLPAERITVAEISRPALEFQQRAFGVRVALSSREPAALELAEKFAVVVVFSLFTHLPESSFSAWLESLWKRVASGGLLIFSVNGEEALFPGRRMPLGGIYFEPVSENADLDASDYGSTWVSERYARQAVDEACRGAEGCFRIERGLWHFQDLFVVARGRETTAGETANGEGGVLPELDVILPPEGYLDTCILLAPNRLQLAGWAIDRQTEGQSPEIRVLINGAEAGRCRATEERRDLARIHGPQFLRSGWLCQCDRPEPYSPDDVVLVEGRGAGGRGTVLHLSRLEGADLTRRVSGALEETRAANLHLQARNAELERQIEAMEASRFWKLRNAWFRFQRSLGVRR